MRSIKAKLMGGVAFTAICLVPAGSVSAQEPRSAQDPPDVQIQAKQARNIQTTDYLVPHISTVPATAGKRVGLFLREKVESRRRGKAPVVLMMAGSGASVIPVFDLEFENYSWMDHLANAGFDVFAMDFTGYGLSPRPLMENPCNTTAADQQLYLIPKPLAQPCQPTYPFQLTSLHSDWDEIDRVVDYIRRVRGVDKVSLIGWSRGGSRAGGYTARHPEKVERLFLYAPGRYFRLNPSDPPAPFPAPGAPINLLDMPGLYRDWESQAKCENQFTTQLRPMLVQMYMDFEPIGSTWGTTGGVRRAPGYPSGAILSGWNAKFAGQVTVPTLIIRGDTDTTVPLADAQDLLGDLRAAPQKVFVHVACGSHYLVWENQHMILLNASLEWLRDGTYWGQFNGTFAVDAAGQVHQER